MRPLPFVLLMLVLSGAFLAFRAWNPWVGMDVLSWPVRLWLVFIVSTCVIGIVRA